MADTSMTMSDPRGAKPRKVLSGRNIMLYGILIVVCVYYLLPLWVMVMTSLKGMPEVRYLSGSREDITAPSPV